MCVYLVYQKDPENGDTMELEGTTLGHYLLQRRLARGGMSEVYLAYDQSTQRTVAIKVVNRYRDDHIQRIQNEVKVLGMLSHPHILPALDYGEEGPWCYFVMPYAERGSLREPLVNGPLTQEKQVPYSNRSPVPCNIFIAMVFFIVILNPQTFC